MELNTFPEGKKQHIGQDCKIWQVSLSQDDRSPQDIYDQSKLVSPPNIFFHFINIGSSFPQERTLHMVDPNLQMNIFHFINICASFPLGKRIRTQSLWPIQVSNFIFSISLIFVHPFLMGAHPDTKFMTDQSLQIYIFTSSIFVQHFLKRKHYNTNLWSIQISKFIFPFHQYLCILFLG